MNINKLELVDNGLNGIIISGIKPKTKEGGETIFVDYNDTYKIPVTRDIIQRFQALKTYMATALNVGLEGFVKEVYDKTEEAIGSIAAVSMTNFLDSLTITKISKKDGVFRIAGKICNLDNGTIGLSTAAITSNTDYGFYEDLNENFMALCTEVNEFRESKKLIKMNARQYMLDLYAKDEEAQAHVQAMTDEETDAAMIQKLEAKGHLVLSPENLFDPEAKVEDITVPDPTPNPKPEVTMPTAPVVPAVVTNEDEF